MRPVDIREIDMHYRDQCVMKWITSRATVDGTLRPVQFKHEEIATEFRCHINTARAIVLRLIGANMIRVETSLKTGGYFYRVIAETAGAA